MISTFQNILLSAVTSSDAAPVVIDEAKLAFNEATETMQKIAAPAEIASAHVLYLISVVCFMLGIMRMGKVRTARSGNALAALAMLLAIVGQFVETGTDINWLMIGGGLAIGSVLGAFMALRVKMTQMPEMVALLNGSGGFASTFVSLAAYFHIVAAFAATPVAEGESAPAMRPLAYLDGSNSFSGEALQAFQSLYGDTINHAQSFVSSPFNAVALVLAIIVGTVTFSGSMIAYGKLSDKWGWKIKLFGKKLNQPILLPGRHVIHLLLLVGAIGCGAAAIWGVGGELAVMMMVGCAVLSLLLGVGLVIGIGGGDMPVVISLLNSYSGVAAALAGFAINSPVLIVSGSMVGAAGLILTKIMCKAMNRSLVNVLFGGFGEVDSGASGGGEYINVNSTDPETAAMLFADAQDVIIVPGYGLAVAQAQHAVRKFADALTARGCNVRYAIHPVAGRMPGHMNVLLAEANVPYEQLVEMDVINSEFANSDIALVLGANDVVNPAAKNDPKSPIAGMPILDVVDARHVYVVKRSLSPGFAGIKNDLFEADNCEMIYGDAKAVVEQLLEGLKEA